MGKIRSIISAALALIMVLMVGVHSVEAAKVKKPATYTPEQLEQIQQYATDLQALRERLPELGTLIQESDWTFTQNFIHGPLGELRVKMQNLARTLLPDAQPNARKLAKEVFNHLVSLDLAAQNSKAAIADREYGAVLEDFDAFLALVPTAARPKPEPLKPASPKVSPLKELLMPDTQPSEEFDIAKPLNEGEMSQSTMSKPVAK
jgi:photosystem II protein PsbQ